MDTKITKERLSRVLAYDWLKIIALIVVVILLWSLMFTMTATRILPSQRFTVFNHYANTSLGNTAFYDSYDYAVENQVFSYEVLEANALDLAAADESYIYTLADTRLSTGEGDLMFVPNIPDEGYAEEEVQYTYAESFLGRYGDVTIVDWDIFLQDVQDYLNGYYGGDYENGALDTAKLENDFRARVKATKDKRYRRESKIEQGVKDEIARLQKYRAAFMQFKGYLDSGLIVVQEISFGEDEFAYTGKFILNLCPDEEKMPKLKETVAYTVTDDDGEVTTTAKDMCVMLFDAAEGDEMFECEAILYLNTVIEKAKAQPTA